jgi:hypothetical protein
MMTSKCRRSIRRHFLKPFGGHSIYRRIGFAPPVLGNLAHNYFAGMRWLACLLLRSACVHISGYLLRNEPDRPAHRITNAARPQSAKIVGKFRYVLSWKRVVTRACAPGLICLTMSASVCSGRGQGIPATFGADPARTSTRCLEKRHSDNENYN